MTTKKCQTCKQDKPFSEFHKNRRGSYGLEHFCKECRKVKAAKSYKNNFFSFMTRLKRSSCKKKGIPFDLDAAFLRSLWKNNCPICSRTLSTHSKTEDSQYALDRIVPSLGYTKGNVEFICQRCNRIKYDASSLELLRIGFWLQLKERSTTISKESTQKSAEAPSPDKSGDDIVCS